MKLINPEADHMEKEPNKRDTLAAVLTVLTAYVTSQAAFIVLQQTGTIRWHWAVVLAPTWVIGGLFSAVIITGTVLGIRKARQKEKAKQQLQEAIKKSLDDFIRTLEDGEEEDIDE